MRADHAPAQPPPRRFHRRRWLWALGGAAGAVATVAAHIRYLEPGRLEVSHHSVQLGAEPGAPVRVLHLSDLHASDYVPLEFIARAIKLGLAEKPDLICLTGDFITKRFSQFADYAEVLQSLAAAAPTFACLGNHDGGKWAARPRYGGHPDHDEVRKCLAAAGATVLLNRSADITLRGRQLRLVGLGDLWAEELSAKEAFNSPASPHTATLALMHNPDGKDAVAGYAWHLALCGHTHGGQCRLPFFGTPFAPVRDHRFVAGLNRWNDRWIYTTRGVGNLLGVRFNCRPEVSLLNLI